MRQNCTLLKKVNINDWRRAQRSASLFIKRTFYQFLYMTRRFFKSAACDAALLVLVYRMMRRFYCWRRTLSCASKEAPDTRSANI